MLKLLMAHVHFMFTIQSYKVVHVSLNSCFFRLYAKQKKIKVYLNFKSGNTMSLLIVQYKNA